ncbi:predicted protein [Plenodomus lingam JN3]|uniref:Predicted protein n=1 Tax=Leptosphaeria maculans (strain JN3 / isolate v23.1.3 / race Av1-4-5-6-7-8) TaxID=985895 RepID=E4ZK19_LEPMJ|nr:predicted protein [Plenodomus lingam JN3]CBX91614.1 predicted protein [Plenodomus lingam JN3]
MANHHEEARDAKNCDHMELWKQRLLAEEDGVLAPGGPAALGPGGTLAHPEVSRMRHDSPLLQQHYTFSMHPAAVTAWISELTSPPPALTPSHKHARAYLCESVSPRKTRRLTLDEKMSTSHTNPVPSPHNEDSDSRNVLEENVTRTPSPLKRRLPIDMYSPDADPVDELDEPTPRRSNTNNVQPVRKLSYRETLDAITDDLHGHGSGNNFKSRFVLRPSTQSQSASTSSARSRSPRKVTSLRHVGSGVTYTGLAATTDLQEMQLGTAGFALLQTLYDAIEGPVFAASLQEHLGKASIGRIRPSQLDHNDDRPIEELLRELHIVQTIYALSNRCVENRDHESEWNNRVHTKVLELALGNDEASVGFRSVTSAKITADFRPTHCPALTTAKIVDYVIFLELSHPARDAVLPLVDMPSQSINHVSYDGLRTRPIAVSIETKTESRTQEEAKVQLGVWLAAQVARIEKLMQETVLLKANKHEAARQAGLEDIRHRQKRPMHTQPQTQDLAQPCTINNVNPDPKHLISQIVFPLLSVQSDVWYLFFGRVSTPPGIADNSDIRKPASPIQIFFSVALGSTANITQTYRLVKSLKALRAWIDEDFRKWWDEVLDVDGDGTEEREARMN